MSVGVSMSGDQARLRAAKPALRLHDDPAPNAETPAHLLDSEITPTELFFVRTNGALPKVPLDARRWRLAVDGEVDRPLELGVAELLARFPAASVTAVLECAGNNRERFAPATSGVQWGPGAVGCAEFSGVRLADVLAGAGLRPRAVYAAFESPDCEVNDPDRPAISRGLPIRKALAPDVLIATHMNGAPLEGLHGAPLRIVAPGFPGSAWQKWLGRIWIREREHDGPKMTGTDYRMPRRRYRPGEQVDPADFAVIEEMPVKTLITRPAAGAVLARGRPVEIRGFAWSGLGAIARVTVSTDGGASWREARLEPAADRFAWARFRCVWAPDAPGPARLLARAIDAAGREQPVEAVWNPRGYLNDSAHAVAVAVRG